MSKKKSKPKATKKTKKPRKAKPAKQVNSAPTGKAVAALREATQLSRTDFAAVLNVSSSTPAVWEGFGKKPIKADSMCRELLLRLTKAPRKATVAVFVKAARRVEHDSRFAGFCEVIRFASARG